MSYDGLDTYDLRTLENLVVGDFIRPSNVQDSLEAADVECLKLFYLSAIHAPAFTVIEQCWYNISIDSDFGGESEVSIREDQEAETFEESGDEVYPLENVFINVPLIRYDVSEVD